MRLKQVLNNNLNLLNNYLIMFNSAPTTAVPIYSPLIQRSFSRRDHIPPRYDVLWRIERGIVRTVTVSEQGTVICLGYWGSGDIVGHRLSRLDPYRIECSTSVEVSILPSELWHQALDAIVLHIQQAEELLNIVHLQPLPLRLWQFLIWLGQKFGHDVDLGRSINLRLTQQEIASAINATRVSVTRTLQQFESEGMLLRRSGQFVLCSRSTVRLSAKFHIPQVDSD